jgi:hypothetical protein
MIRQQCELCLPERRDQRYCEHDACPLFVYCPRQPGGTPKRAMSPRQRYTVELNLARQHGG